jgi:hypothetical protein
MRIRRIFFKPGRPLDTADYDYMRWLAREYGYKSWFWARWTDHECLPGAKFMP